MPGDVGMYWMVTNGGYGGAVDSGGFKRVLYMNSIKLIPYYYMSIVKP